MLLFVVNYKVSLERKNIFLKVRSSDILHTICALSFHTREQEQELIFIIFV